MADPDRQPAQNANALANNNNSGAVKNPHNVIIFAPMAPVERLYAGPLTDEQLNRLKAIPPPPPP